MKRLLISISLTVFAFASTTPNDIAKVEKYFDHPGVQDEMTYLNMLEYESVDQDLIRDYSETSNTYRLYTRSNPYEGQILIPGNDSTIANSNFNKTVTTVLLIHGWNGHGRNDMNLMLTEAFLEDSDSNVIVVDWSELATRNYITAKLGVPEVGKFIGRFLQWLETLGASYDKMHMVGFSLGAHIIGNAGRDTGSRVKRITDPGGPLWKKDKNRLMETDARYVEVIHTNTALYGYEDPCGHADFYPNGGYRMPGCFLNYCSHRRSYEYMTATLKLNHLFANECASLQDAIGNNCHGLTYPMGNSDLTKTRSGIFRVNTEKHITSEYNFYNSVLYSSKRSVIVDK